MTRTSVTTMADLATLDSDEVLEGYRDGFAGEPEPGDNRSRSYWHGWRNGALDGERRAKDDAQALLAAAYVRAQARCEIDTDSDHDSHRASIEISYVRPESDEEMAARIEGDRLLAEQKAVFDRARDLETLRRLQAKYGAIS